MTICDIRHLNMNIHIYIFIYVNTCLYVTVKTDNYDLRFSNIQQ